jgi:DNA-binding CsgD family transcriptional regulator
VAVDDTSLRPVKIHRRAADARPVLRVIAGRACGEVFVLTRPETTIGRDEGADIRLQDRGVSRMHAKFVRARDGLVSVLDLGSTNGTFINGTRVELSAMREGDRLQLGPEAVLQLGYEEEERRGAEEPLPLSSRQLEVARLVALGMTNTEIAERLGISPRTVASHLDHIYDRLGISSRAALTRALALAGELPEG